MNWAVEWSPVSYGDVQRMHWRTASRLCAAIYRFAETGRGNIEEQELGYRLRIRGALAMIWLDAETKTVVVWRLFAAR